MGIVIHFVLLTSYDGDHQYPEVEHRFLNVHILRNTIRKSFFYIYCHFNIFSKSYLSVTLKKQTGHKIRHAYTIELSLKVMNLCGK